MRVRSHLSLGAVSADVVASAASDVGSVRRINEDSFLASPTVFLVADGMGGHEAGEKASATVRETFEAAVAGGEPLGATQVLDAIAASNALVRGDDRSSDVRSGTTLAGVAIVTSGAGLTWMAFNIGDSRVYQWDGRRLSQLSVDHSAVQELIDAGFLNQSEAAVHPDRNVITRAIGAADDVDPDVWLMPIVGTQTFLVCSDGLTKEIDDDGIAEILARESTDAPAALVAAALAAGGNDNVTALVVRSVAVHERADIEDTSDRSMREAALLEDTRPRP